ncbi:FYVE-type zinc finger-containing protein C9B6.03 [Apiospora kogelbergensis]|uniref:FYVE-type zinc finger-containing protein C9B6.03 n=1 Tax=Apiospora kogelbergensis TaxID=1337665 RepID=A0AAW0QV50_9PEZI
MATELIMPRLPDQQQPFAHFYTPQYNPQSPGFQSQAQTQAQQVYTQPQISPLSTSNNASPTSPKSYHGRQVRPLYMPAVLRPTERQTRAVVPGKKTEDDNESLKMNSSFISLAGLGALGRLSRRSTGDSGKSVDNEWNFALFPKPTALPTKSHWKPDTGSTICDEPSCRRHFNYWTRRHHCRRCGNIFCDPHSAFEIPLDQDANYNPRGIMSRACQHCYTEFKSWRSRTNSQASSIASSRSSSGGSDAGSAYHTTSGSQSVPASPVDATGAAPIPAATGKVRVQHKEIVASVPRDWNWSTF